MDLREAEDIKKRWQEYTKELYKKDLHNPDNLDRVITHLEPDILECEVKWALGSITRRKANLEVMEFQLSFSFLPYFLFEMVVNLFTMQGISFLDDFPRLFKLTASGGEPNSALQHLLFT